MHTSAGGGSALHAVWPACTRVPPPCAKHARPHTPCLRRGAAGCRQQAGAGPAAASRPDKAAGAHAGQQHAAQGQGACACRPCSTAPPPFLPSSLAKPPLMPPLPCRCCVCPLTSPPAAWPSSATSPRCAARRCPSCPGSARKWTGGRGAGVGGLGGRPRAHARVPWCAPSARARACMARRRAPWTWQARMAAYALQTCYTRAPPLRAVLRAATGSCWSSRPRLKQDPCRALLGTLLGAPCTARGALERWMGAAAQPKRAALLGPRASPHQKLRAPLPPPPSSQPRRRRRWVVVVQPSHAAPRRAAGGRTHVGMPLRCPPHLKRPPLPTHPCLTLPTTRPACAARRPSAERSRPS